MMELSLSGNALKTFGRSITCLARVGYELVIQAFPFRTPIASMDLLTVKLADPNASKVQWALECSSGMKKAYWITCNVGPNRRRFQSNLVVRPCDLNRLLTTFQSSLLEITIIATEPTLSPSDCASEIGGKAVELRSYIDPTKERNQINGNVLSQCHPSNWIDAEEDDDDDDADRMNNVFSQHHHIMKNSNIS